MLGGLQSVCTFVNVRIYHFHVTFFTQTHSQVVPHFFKDPDQPPPPLRSNQPSHNQNASNKLSILQHSKYGCEMDWNIRSKLRACQTAWLSSQKRLLRLAEGFRLCRFHSHHNRRVLCPSVTHAGEKHHEPPPRTKTRSHPWVRSKKVRKCLFQSSGSYLC